MELAKAPTKYLDADTIPEGFKVLDPSKLTKSMVSDLWSHWFERAKAKLPILVFIEAREQDMGRKARCTVDIPMDISRPLAGRKRTPYNYNWSDDEASDGEMGSLAKDGADKGKGTSRSPARPAPSKRPRISDEGSPAGNCDDRQNFLYGLSTEPSYKALLNSVLLLAACVSPFFFYFFI